MPPLSRDDLIMALMKDINPDQDPELYAETLQAYEQASDRVLNVWYNQQNDPQQAQENAYTAAIKSDAHMQMTDLSQHRMPDLSDEDRSAVMKEISESVDSLSQDLKQSEDLQQDLKQQH